MSSPSMRSGVTTAPHAAVTPILLGNAAPPAPNSTVPSKRRGAGCPRPSSMASPRPLGSPPRRIVQASQRWSLALAGFLALAIAALALSLPAAPQHALVAPSSRVDGRAAPSAASRASGHGAVQLASSPTIPSSTLPTAVATPPSALASPASPSTSPIPSAAASPDGWGWGLPDPTQWVRSVLSAILTAFFSGVLTALVHILDWAQGFGGSAFNFVTRTPPEGTYASSSVVARGAGWWAWPTRRWRSSCSGAAMPR